MEDPLKEIESVILTITSAVNPEIQKAAILRYFAPDVTFRHPLTTIPSSSLKFAAPHTTSTDLVPSPFPANQASPSLTDKTWYWHSSISTWLSPTGWLTRSSRETVLRVYQWYRVLSPVLVVRVKNITYDREKEEMFIEVIQTFHIRWNPLPPADLITHINLRKLPSNLYVIAAQEDFYHPEDLVSFVIPPFAPVVHTLLLLGAWVCVIQAWLGSVLGFWSVRDGEGGRGVSLNPEGEELPPQSEQERKDLGNEGVSH
ncbi:hypothetical protein WOLCODRAFT_165810 [Wolfiporia cocos MD-104 SS10]|uniref:SigF-like NTF2-like domain-containing protein n=1 Tax=Wolfiporia cocos (strain MD-104) TaxID=742152 RepID=A0A2H3IXT3_WOLCO|nr:hypothetical protein WOLCODRAFT_165810 [Wolfiporia cocos MD-104 SS10]